MTVKRFVFASDLHGDVQDHETVGKLYKFLDIWQPDVTIFGGDLFDFRNIRRGAGAAEKQDSMAADVEAGLEFLQRYQPKVLLLGNHDKRLWDVANYDTHGIVQDYAKQGVKDIENRCRKLKCKVIGYKSDRGFYDLGKLRFIHGFAAGIYATKKHAEIYSPEGGCVLHGHTHTISHHIIPRVNGGQGRAVGCLAQLDMPYNIAQPARIMHQHGWAYGWVDGKDFEIFQAKANKQGEWQVIEKTVKI